MRRESQVRICEGLRGQFPRPTRLIIVGKNRDVLEQKVKPLIKRFLENRGLELSEEKTKITHIYNGFDFLGQNIRKYRLQTVVRNSS